MVTGSPGSGMRVWPNSGKASESITEPPLIVSSQCMMRSPSRAGIERFLLRAEDGGVIGDRRGAGDTVR